jgi:hypothetical protein
MFACGGNTTTGSSTPPANPPAVADGPPWEALSDAERSVYVDQHACPEATAMVESLSDWEVIESEEVEPGTFVEVRMGASGMGAVLQYVENNEGVRVNQMAMLSLSPEAMLLMIDYNVLRAFHTGAASPDDEDALRLATGEYFCVYM